uniref:Uncharacterized protein n=1 Tax=Arundo donax TaxID=35708 RepID=A0A0A9GFP0_ARUDO
MLLGQPVPLSPYQLCERRAGVRRAAAAAVFKIAPFLLYLLVLYM